MHKIKVCVSKTKIPLPAVSLTGGKFSLSESDIFSFDDKLRRCILLMCRIFFVHNEYSRQRIFEYF